MILPIYQHGKFQPVDLFKTTTPKILKLEIKENGRNWVVAAGLNWSDEIDGKGMDVALLNLPDSTHYLAYDVFKKEYIGLISSDTTLGPVNPHGVLLVNLVPDLNRPQVIGSDLPISQGGVEISHEIWYDQTNSLSIGLNDLYGRKGHLYIYAPPNFTLDADQSYQVHQVKTGSLISVPVTLDTKKTIKFRFEK